ncbi:MAG TPA: alkaline phosphatase family protein [Ktedonobacteraceae bacterium]|jgi:phospholipase C|nr:alkaline phosphatase family protein [Ktedonobacteraceae bacterium]
MNPQVSRFKGYLASKQVYLWNAFVILLVLVGMRPLVAASAAKAAPQASNPIKHIVIMVKENRSFDSMFGTFPGADGATTYKDKKGKIHPLNHQPDHLTFDLAHNYPAFLTAYDHGKMDGFSKIAGAIQIINGKKMDVADSQFYQADIPNYWQYAQTFALPDEFFYTIRSESFPNHLFSIAATDNDVDENPQISNLKYINTWGCDDPKGTTVEERHSNGKVENVFPCFTFQTLGDLLSAQNISWKSYSPSFNKDGYEWNAYDAIQGIRNTNQWKQHFSDYTNFVKDAASGNLPTVSWLVQPSGVSDHPPESVCAGENWTVQQINAIMQNQSLWNSTAIFLTWDDFGGFYDHVKPSNGPNQKIEYGFRAPLIIISPYAKPHYVDNTFYSFPSMLKFAEKILGLPSLGGLDQGASDMFNSFNFKQQPLPPLILQQRTCPSYTQSGPSNIDWS